MFVISFYTKVPFWSMYVCTKIAVCAHFKTLGDFSCGAKWRILKNLKYLSCTKTKTTFHGQRWVLFSLKSDDTVQCKFNQFKF